MARLLTIGQLAKKSGTTTKAVRYYGALGLLKAAGRAENNYRLFDEGAVDRLLFIRRAKLLGLTLKEIQDLLEAANRGGCHPLRWEVAELLARKIDLCHARIQELEELQQFLESRLSALTSEHQDEGVASPLSPDCTCLPVDASVLRAGAPPVRRFSTP